MIDMYSWQDKSESTLNTEQVSYLDDMCSHCGGREWMFISWDSKKRGSIQVVSNLQEDGCSLDFLQALLVHMWRGLEEFKSSADAIKSIAPERMDA